MKAKFDEEKIKELEDQKRVWDLIKLNFTKKSIKSQKKLIDRQLQKVMTELSIIKLSEKEKMCQQRCDQIKTIELQPLGEELASSYTFPQTKEHFDILNSLQYTQVKDISISRTNFFDSSCSGVSFDFIDKKISFGKETEFFSRCSMTEKPKFIEILQVFGGDFTVKYRNVFFYDDKS